MKIVIFSALLIFLTNSYPIAVYNSNLGKKDLFTTQDNLVNSLREEQRKVVIYNIQTSITEGDILQGKLLKAMENLIQFSDIMKKKSTFVSPYVDYEANDLIEKLQENSESQQVEVISINLSNIKQIEQSLKKRTSDSIILIIFSKISTNFKLLEEISSTLNQDLIAAQVETETEDETTETNEVYNVTSNELTGYILFFILFYALWVSIQCMDQIITPDKFTKQNFFVGKEN